MARSDGKTEKATPHRQREARKEGTVAKSQEVGVAASFLLLALAVKVFLPHGGRVVAEETRRLLHFGPTAELPAGVLADSAGRMAVAVLAPLLTACVVAALVAGVAQVGFKPTPKAAMPKLSHLSPKKGLQRLKPATATWELVRTSAKLGLLCVIVIPPLRQWSSEIAAARGLAAGLERTLDQAWALLLRVLLLAIVIAAADYAWQRRKTARDLRMSTHEVKREFKSQEGDPLVKAQRRRRASELSRNRMLADAGGADVIVTNPTHLAIAIRYDAEEGAPRVVARGADKIAAKIRAEAFRHGVPLVEDVPLARALYRQCRVGHFVPAALYQAVAVVLAVAYRRRGVAPSRAGAGA